MLTNMKDMLCEARKAKRAVGAFNVANYETALAVFRAAEAEREPVIVQLYMRLFDTGKARDLAPTLRGLAERATVPVALHLDHGSTEKQAADALAWGYTSVMFDGSRLPFDENAARTKAVADAAHAAGATCEGEIGHVAMGDETALTEPDEAAACLGYLRAQFALVRPQVVVLLGRVACQYTLREQVFIGRDHGRWFQQKGVWFMPTYHPSALLRDESLKRPAWEDFKAVRDRAQALKEG